ncbi:MAG: hypothetical protein ABI665_26310, partial [Vicinamibacterales bacterium]
SFHQACNACQRIRDKVFAVIRDGGEGNLEALGRRVGRPMDAVGPEVVILSLFAVAAKRGDRLEQRGRSAARGVADEINHGEDRDWNAENPPNEVLAHSTLS